MYALDFATNTPGGSASNSKIACGHGLQTLSTSYTLSEFDKCVLRLHTW